MRRALIAGLPILMMGCATDSPTAAVTPPNIRPSLSWATDRYPTEEEYYANGGQDFGTAGATKPANWFHDGATQFSSKSIVAFAYSNKADAALDARLIDQSGAEINSDQDTFGYDAFIPILSEKRDTLSVTLSTNNKTCGLIGKGKVTGLGALRVIKWGNLVTLWSTPINEIGTDQTLPSCTCGGGGGGGADSLPPQDARRQAYRTGPSLSCTGTGGGGGDGYTLQICYVLDYYSSEGRYMYTINLGCEYVNVE